MTRMKLANVLLESSRQFFAEPALYCLAEGPLIEANDGSWVLRGPAAFDFTTYFNALSVEKWMRYTPADGFVLHLELKGAACTYVQTRADSYSWRSEEIEPSTIELPESPEWRALDIPIAVDALAFPDVLEGFKLTAHGDVLLRNAYYSAEVPEGAVRPVELALCSTTFKKERYIERNIALAKERILGGGEPVAAHFTMHVVDNGGTLDAAALETDRVRIHANPNAGGAGGFARGMIEARAQEPRATHVLLMDDDVELSAESIVRTYTLLSLVRDEYADALLSGAMMSMADPALRWEDIGYMSFAGYCHPLKPAGYMTSFQAFVTSEVYHPRPDVPSWEDQAQLYAAWWYCCIPVSVIDRVGLPMPFFVRYDDVEYGLRCGSRVMSMCGICIWHEPFNLRYNAAVERYQTARNGFVLQALGLAPLSDFADALRQNVHLELKKFNYVNAELALDGFEDFLAGPERLMEPGFAEESFMRANRSCEKLVPFSELVPLVRETYGIDLEEITSVDVSRTLPRGRRDAAIDLLTFNGQRLDAGYFQKGTVAVIDATGGSYQPGTMRRADTLIAVDLANRTGIVRHPDPERFREVWSRFKRDMKEYKANREALEAAWREALPTVRSEAYWRDYLGLEPAGQGE